MDLDRIELAMQCEEALGISIPDADVESFADLGALHDTAVALFNATHNTHDIEPLVWEQVRAIASELFEVPIDRVTRGSRVVEGLGLLPPLSP